MRPTASVGSGNLLLVLSIELITETYFGHSKEVDVSGVSETTSALESLYDGQRIRSQITLSTLSINLNIVEKLLAKKRAQHLIEAVKM